MGSSYTWAKISAVTQYLWCEEPGYSHLPTACNWYVVVTAVFYMETWVFLGCRSTQCKLEKTCCRPTTVVPSTNHKISLCKLRRLVDKNLDAICELPVLLSLSSTLFLNVSLTFSEHLQTKSSKTSQRFLKTRCSISGGELESFTLKIVGQGSQESRYPDYPSDHWVTLLFILAFAKRNANV